jgi:hypothetical protein
LAASISVEAVTPPLVGLAFKELPLFSGVMAGKSNSDGGRRSYQFSGKSSEKTVLAIRHVAKAEGGEEGHGQDSAAPLNIVIEADINFVGSLTEVAVTVTVPPRGTCAGAR